MPDPRGVPAPGRVVWRPPMTATAAGGTHPTGVHSCSFYLLSQLMFLTARKLQWFWENRVQCSIILKNSQLVHVKSTRPAVFTHTQ